VTPFFAENSPPYTSEDQSERRAVSRESRRARDLPATKPHKLTPARQEQLRRLAATGEPVRELAAAFGIGRTTAYRYIAGARHPNDS
jgi:DNA invertase Pin-like site-specific DNA recombinase